MATRNKDKAVEAPVLDRKGLVTVKNGDTVAKILPESLDVWTRRGWAPVDPESVTEAEADPFTDNEIDTVDDSASAAPKTQEG